MGSPAQMSPEDAPGGRKWRKQILIAVVAIGVLLLMIMTVLFLQLKQMKAEDLYEKERYRSVVMLNHLKPLEKKDKVYVGLAYDRLGKREEAYSIYRDVYHVLEVFPSEIYLDGYKGYLCDAYLLGYLTREALEQQDYTVTGYGEELVTYREELIAGVYDDDDAVVAGDSESEAKTYSVISEGDEILTDVEPIKKGGKLLFPAMAIAKASQYMSPYDPEITDGYTDITDDDGVEVYEINDYKYVPEFKILQLNHEYGDPCYDYGTEPVVKDDELYVDLDTLRVVTGMDYDLDEEKGILTLTLNEDNLSDTDGWVDIVMPDSEGDEVYDEADDAEAAGEDGWEDAASDEDFVDDETDWNATDYDLDSDDDQNADAGYLNGREYYEYVAKYFKEHR